MASTRRLRCWSLIHGGRFYRNGCRSQRATAQSDSAQGFNGDDVLSGGAGAGSLEGGNGVRLHLQVTHGKTF